MIGGNANLEFYKQIDNLNERIDANTADKYSNTKTYSKDEYCIYNDTLYKANQDISTPEEFTVAHWDVTTVAEELNMLSSSMVTEKLTDFFTPAEGITVFSSLAYKIGNIVQININLYKTDESVFSKARTDCGTLSLGGDILASIFTAAASNEIGSYVNRLVGCYIYNNQIMVDVQSGNTDVKYITITKTLFIP